MAEQERPEGTVEFVAGLIVGLAISLPAVAWLAPRGTDYLRDVVVQRGLIIRRRVGEAVRRPLAQVEQQLERVRGESVEEALAEGRAIAARRWRGAWQGTERDEGGR
ncbi:MAG: hypothetical protein KatS3mg051_0504 [Anaerolineae bacterium]|nr:MAG: hypothetical protein KatS3mg051_0504 [Anaerolineae bacterium]